MSNDMLRPVSDRVLRIIGDFFLKRQCSRIEFGGGVLFLIPIFWRIQMNIQ